MKRKLMILFFALIATNCYVGKSITPPVQKNVDVTVTSRLLELKKNSEADLPQLNSWTSPDGQWKIKVKKLNSDLEGGFFALEIQQDSSNSRTLFTLWDADVGSGARVNLRWTPDSKAVRLKGDTRGFRYEGVNGSTREQPFDFIYLIDTATLYTTP